MAPLKHGMARRTSTGRVKSSEYSSWRGMKSRCLNPNHQRFKDYGGRGITVCSRWADGEGSLSGFSCFLSDMGAKPSSEMTMERIDNDRGYEPGNVVWVHRSKQARNTRATHYVEIGGLKISFAEAVERFGAVSMTVARMRVHRGWDSVSAITTPKSPPGNPAGWRSALSVKSPSSTARKDIR